MANNSAYVEVVDQSATRFTDASDGDLVIYTDTSNQSICMGVKQGATSTLKVNSNAVNVTGNINFTGSLTQNGVPFVSGGSSLSVDSTNNALISTSTSWSTIQPFVTYFANKAMAIDGPGVENALGVAIDSFNSIYVAGTSSNVSPNIYHANTSNANLSLPALGSNVAFAVKYDAAGNASWSVVIDGVGNETATSIATDTNNSVIVAGSYSSSNIVIYNATGSSNTVAALPAPSNSAAYVVKYDSTGTSQWATLVDSAGIDSVNAVKTDAANNVYVAGIATGSNAQVYDNTTTITQGNYATDALAAVTTAAGDGTSGYQDGNVNLPLSSFKGPNGVAIDSAGNVYVADATNNRIRKITPAGIVSTLAGNGNATFVDGAGISASFNNPNSVAVDSSGNVYVSDQNNHRIRKISPTGQVSTLAGSGVGTFAEGTGTNASFKSPQGIAVDSTGTVYVADYANSRIRKILSTGEVSTLAGSGANSFSDGTGTNASFRNATGVAVDNSGNLYVADYGSHRIRKIIISTGDVSTIAGSGVGTFADGKGTSASFNYPQAISVDSSGNVYVADYNNNRIRKIITSTGDVSTLAGSGANSFSDGTGTNASFWFPSGVAVDSSGNVYVGDNANNRIRKITSTGGVTTYAGNGTATFVDGNALSVRISAARGIAFDSYGNAYVADTGNNRIRKITPTGVITTLAGSGNATFANGTGTAASFWTPYGVAVDSSGNVYVADSSNNRIRKVSPAGVVTTFAGSGNATFAEGTGTNASFRNPQGVAIDSSGNLYVADANNNRIRKITSDGVVTTLAGNGNATFSDGTGTNASFNSPFSVSVDSSGNVYVADYSNNRIRKITPTGVVTTLAGSGNATFVDGTGAAAGFYWPSGVAVDSSGNVYVADYGSNRIRKITSAGVVTTLAGSGAASFADGINASFNSPIGVGLDNSGNVYVADFANQRIRRIEVLGTEVATLAGNGTPAIVEGTGQFASFNVPNGVAVDSAGNMYVADHNNHKIRKITPSGVVSTLAGSGFGTFADGTGISASFNNPNGLCVDSSGNVYVADKFNQRIRKITPTGQVSTLAGSGNATFADGTGASASFNVPAGTAVDSSGNVYVADASNNRIRKITSTGIVSTLAGSGAGSFADGTGTNASFWSPYGLGVDSSGNVYVADTFNHRIRKITPTGVVTTLAGSGTAQFADGTGTNAIFNIPVAVVADGIGNVYVADKTNNRIRKITPAGVVTTVAGNGTATFVDGIGANASFNGPCGVALDSSGNVYVADTINNRIRKIAPAIPVSTLAGNGVGTFADGPWQLASFKSTRAVATDSAGNVYVADTANNRIRKITPSGIASTLAGSGNATFADGTGTNASFSAPWGIAVDSSGTVYVGDSGNHRIRRITPTGVVTTFAGSGNATFANGTGTNASFNTPTGVAVDSSGTVYVADFNNSRIRKITSDGAVNTMAGSGNATFADGTGTNASFVPYGVAVDSSGNVFVADGGNHRIRKITFDGIVSTLAGSGAASFADGTGTGASLWGPQGISVDRSGNIFVADTGNQRIRKITSAGVVTTVAGSGNITFVEGNGIVAGFNALTGVALDNNENLYVADFNNNRIRKLTNPALPSASSSVTVSASVKMYGSLSNQSAFALKYNSTGTSQWSVTVDGSAPDVATSIATDANMNVFIAGQYGPGAATVYANSNASSISSLIASGNTAAYAVKINSNGVPQWGVRIDGLGNELALGCQTDTSGNLYVAGTYDGAATIYDSNNTAFATALPAPTTRSSFLVKYDTNGVPQWATRIEGVNNSNVVTAVAVDSSSSVYVVGSYGGSSSPKFYNAAGVQNTSLSLPATLNAGLVEVREIESCATDHLPVQRTSR